MKTIRVTDPDRGILQVTTADERWYARPRRNPSTGLPEYEFVPSVTWIAGHYPKGIGFYRWLAGRGWDEAEAVKSAAGEKGSKVHQAIAQLLAGATLSIESPFADPDSGRPGPLTLEEWECLMSFAAWFEEAKPEILGVEYGIWNDELGYAGTVDLKVRLEGQRWIVDVKTGQNVWPEYELQVSAYKHAELDPVDRLAILQVGYRKNRKGFKFTPVEDRFDLFLAARTIWAHETRGAKPLQRDYPLTLHLDGAGNGARWTGLADAIEDASRPTTEPPAANVGDPLAASPSASSCSVDPLPADSGATPPAPESRPFVATGVWNRQQRGGYGFTERIHVREIRRTAKRILVEAPLKAGGTKQVWISRDHYTPANPDDAVAISTVLVEEGGAL